MQESLTTSRPPKSSAFMWSLIALITESGPSSLVLDIAEFGYFCAIFLVFIAADLLDLRTVNTSKIWGVVQSATQVMLMEHPLLWYGSNAIYLGERAIFLGIDIFIFMGLFKKLVFEGWKRKVLRLFVLTRYYYLAVPLMIHLAKPLQCTANDAGLYTIQNSTLECYSLTGAIITILSISCLISHAILSFLVLSINFNLSCKTTGLAPRRNNSDKILIVAGVASNFLASIAIGSDLRTFGTTTICGVVLYLQTKQNQYRNIRFGKISRLLFQIGFILSIYESLAKAAGYSASEFAFSIIVLVLLLIMIQSFARIRVMQYLPLDDIMEGHIAIGERIFRLEYMVFLINRVKIDPQSKVLVDGYIELRSWRDMQRKNGHRFRSLLFGSTTCEASGASDCSFEPLKNLIALKYINSIKYDPGNLLLELSYIWFIYETLEYKIEAYQRLSVILKNNYHLFSWSELLIAEKMWFEISSKTNDLIKSKSNYEFTGDLDLTVIKKTERMLGYLDRSSIYILNLWQYLEEDVIKVDILTDKIDSCVLILDEMSTLWNKNYKTFILNPSLLNRYGNYLSFVLNDNQLSEYFKGKANIELKYRKNEARGFLKIKSLNDNLGKSSYGLMIIRKVFINSVDIKLDIYRCNLSLASMLGYHQASFLESENLNKIIPIEWVSVLLMLFSKDTTFSFSDQTIYMKKNCGILVRTLSSMRHLIDEFFICEVKREFEYPEVPEIIYKRSDSTIIGHTSCMMKYFDIEYFDLKSLGILKITDINYSIKTPNLKTKKKTLGFTRGDCKKDSMNSIYSVISSENVDRAKNRLLGILNELEVEKTQLSFCDIGNQLGISKAVFKRKECAPQYTYHSMIDRPTQFSFNYNIDTLVVIGMFGEDSDYLTKPLRNSRIVSMILKSEEAIKNTTNVLENSRKQYGEGIRVTRLIEGGTKMMEINYLDNNSEDEEVSERAQKPTSKKEEKSRILNEIKERTLQSGKQTNLPKQQKSISTEKKIIDVPKETSQLLKCAVTVHVLFCFFFISLCAYSIYQVKSLHSRITHYGDIPINLIKLEQVTTTINSMLTDLQFSHRFNASELDLRYRYIEKSLEVMNTYSTLISGNVIAAGDAYISYIYFSEQKEYLGFATPTTIFNGLKVMISTGYDLVNSAQNRSIDIDKDSQILLSFCYFTKSAYESIYNASFSQAVAFNSNFYTERLNVVIVLACELVTFVIVTCLCLFIFSTLSNKEKKLFLQIRSPSLSSLVRRCEKFVAWRGENSNDQNEDNDEQNLGIGGQEAGSIHEGSIHEGSSVASEVNMKGGGLVLGIASSMVRGLPRRRKLGSHYLNIRIVIVAIIFLPLLVMLVLLQIQSKYKMSDIDGFYEILQVFPLIGRFGQVGYLQKKIMSEIDSINPRLIDIYNQRAVELKTGISMFYFISTLITIKSANPEIAAIGSVAHDLLYSNNCQLLRGMAKTRPPDYFELEPDACNKGFIDSDLNSQGFLYSLPLYLRYSWFLDKIIRDVNPLESKKIIALLDCTQNTGNIHDLMECFTFNKYSREMGLFSDLFLENGPITICFMLLGQKLVNVEIQEYYTSVVFALVFSISIMAILFGLIPFLIMHERKEQRVKHGVSIIPFEISSEIMTTMTDQK